MQPQGFRSPVHERADRGRPLTPARQRENRRTSRVRVRVDQVFAALTQMDGMRVRPIGIERLRNNPLDGIKCAGPMGNGTVEATERLRRVTATAKSGAICLAGRVGG